MNKTEFLLRLKMQKGLSYLKILQVMQQMPPDEDVDHEWLSCLELPDELILKVESAFFNDRFESAIERVQRQFKIITFFDDLYPVKLREIYRPPVLLFAMGDLGLLEREITVIVGSRTPTAYSRQVIENLMPELLRRKQVIASGLAQGVDAIAHQTTLNYGGKTIAVVGNGLNYFYPQGNMDLQRAIAKKGLLLSEYLPDTPPKPFRFPERNRILAGICKNVIVTEAKEHSGSLITANLALQENRNVYAIPGQINSPLSVGTNQLISAGATPIIGPRLEGIG
ncbi:DNA-processing protein DprA [Lactobacillus porci]|uniref:DNA-protecting protein DprA n=1 Tax=Lactobacillus porci TaxID=2012477 RepID=A0A6A8ME17_9LACO|nr:DNA-processing protein DprA [Lactobacillus porci]MDD6415582.1 DNA-processing protein DprA [Lactobacillus porci]MST87031.1 DNA-protecting protein DprA [Lactobacillus porci]